MFLKEKQNCKNALNKEDTASGISYNSGQNRFITNYEEEWVQKFKRKSWYFEFSQKFVWPGFPSSDCYMKF